KSIRIANGSANHEAHLPKHRLKKKTGKAIPTTRVSVIVISTDQKILLVKHRKGNKQYWVLPGGRLEYGETFQECGAREVKEETGLEVAVDKMVFVSEAIAPDRSRHIINVYLTASITGGTMRLGNEPVLAGVDFLPVAELETSGLYPPVGKQILAGLKTDSLG